MRRWIGLIAGLALTFALAVFVAREIGVQQLFSPWRSLPQGVLAAGLATQWLSYWTRALRIAQLEPRVGLRRSLACTRLVLIHNALNLLLPMRAGELSFPWLMQRWFGCDPARSTGLLIWLRVLDLHVLAGLTLGTLIWLAPGLLDATGGRVGIALLGAALLGPLLVFGAARPLDRWCAANPRRRDSRLGRFAGRLLAGVPMGPVNALLTLAWTWLSWAIKLAGLALVYAALAGDGPLIGLLAAIGGDLSSVLPVHSPGGFGTYEAGVAAALAPVRAIDKQVIGAAVNLHLFVLGVALGSAALAAIWPGRPSRSLPRHPADS